MCRLVGFIRSGKESFSEEKTLENMRDSMIIGGPDHGGIYMDEQICLGHRRLSILDLSDAGNQPYYFKNYVVIYNGEVYNFKEISAQLEAEGIKFESTSDTEVIIKAFDFWGFEAVEHFRGMFSFVIWNKETKQLILCRDRIGVKPLFIYKKDDLIMFSSELKAFHQHPRFDKNLNPFAIKRFLDKGYISSPNCIYKYVEKVLPGHYYILDDGSKSFSKKPYWSIENIYNESSVLTKNENEIEEKLESLLQESFDLRMVADVPVGMFLSGGLDSTLVSAMLQKKSSLPLKTFTIGFKDEKLNEAKHAQEISNYLGTEHQELYCTEDDLANHIKDLPEIYDEPLGTPSVIPTYLVSKLAKQSVKVSLSADGGDELFGGYSKYEAAINYFPKIQKLPKAIRQNLYRLSKGYNSDKIDKYFSGLPILNRYSNVGNKILKLRQAMLADDLESFFYSSSSYVDSHILKKLMPIDYSHNYPSLNISPQKDQTLSYLGVLDIKTYLEGEIMCKVDRATMHNSLEGREPFLDHKLIEFALTIPDNLKINSGKTKYIIRKILSKYVPTKLTERPKQGFVVPIYSLLMVNLKDHVLEMSLDSEFTETFSLNFEQLKTSIDSFYKHSEATNPYFIWHLFVLYQWYNKWIKTN